MISLILPTLGDREGELLRLINSLNNQVYKNFELIVISQDNHKIISGILENADFNYKQVISKVKGLSVARNIGLNQISSNSIITFTDDDCWYYDTSLELVSKYFENKDKEIMIFQHIDPTSNKFPKKYSEKSKDTLNILELMSHASIDIFIDTSKVKDYKIGFDENFGLGTKYNSGEENIYLVDLKKMNYNISYEPVIISYHLNKVKKYKYDKNYYLTKYNLFIRMFGKKQGIIIYAIFILKRKFKLIKYRLY